MSYRTIKRLLGETSLERKFRFLLGGGMMLLIFGSFYLYATLNRRLIDDPNELKARYQVPSILQRYHWEWAESSDDIRPIIGRFSDDLKPAELSDYSWQVIKADPTTASGRTRPFDDVDVAALEAMRGGGDKFVHIDKPNKKYVYYAGVRATQSCIDCHWHGREPGMAVGKLLGVVKVSIPLANTQRAIATNNAILLTMAIVTSFLAMLAAYVIVKYVIVKPVLHLKDVSDGIARGTLDLRADIRTGDEFEELSHAFNRMLRHLVTVQDELRQVNADLDGKVDELAQVNLKLYEMNKIKDEFLATVSHELRTPLNSILGFSDVLANADNLNDRQKRFVKNILTSGTELMRLINDLLDLAKIESGKMELQIIEFSLADLVEQQASGVAPLAMRKNLDLSWRVDPALGTLVQDAGKIQQILNNLLTNAIKFTPEGGRIRVRGEPVDDKTFALLVEDSGVGIPLEEQELIFEKFRQGRSIPGQRDAMTRQHGGTGLGLSIVKELSKLLGGEVTLESEFGKGSTFTLRLPMRLEEQHQQRLLARLDERMLEMEHSGDGVPVSTEVVDVRAGASDESAA